MNRQAYFIISKRVYGEDVKAGTWVMKIEDVVDLLGHFGIEEPDYQIKNEVTPGNVIEFLRTKIKMSAQELAAKAGVQISVISRMENHDYSVGMNNVLKMLNVMGFNFHDYADAYDELKSMNQ